MILLFMLGKSVTLSVLSVDWVEHMQHGTRKNFSQALDNIVIEHKQMFPNVRKQKNLDNLRAAAANLAHDCNIDQKAILAWVKEATEGNK